jgi:hypothetical protein
VATGLATGAKFDAIFETMREAAEAAGITTSCKPERHLCLVRL